MKIFVDTANLDEIKEAESSGVIDGVTTNPSLIAKEKVDIQLETLGWTRYKELYTKGTRTYLLHLTSGKINKLKHLSFP